jgi:hypothetical protein
MAIGASTDAQERSATYADWIAQSEADLAAVDAAWQNLVSDREAVNRTCVAALTAGDVQGALAPSRLRGANTGDALLDRLSVTDLAVLARTDPDLAAKLMSADPVKVRDWWAGLGEGERTVLIRRCRRSSATSRASRTAIATRRTARGSPSRSPRSRTTSMQAASAPRHRRTVAPGISERGSRRRDARTAARPQGGIQNALAPGRQLISLTGGSPPLAAIAIGDMDTAQNVTYAVPGMGSSAEGMGDWVESARNVSAAQGLMAPGRPTRWSPGSDTRRRRWDRSVSARISRGRAPHLGTALRVRGHTSDAQLNVLAHSYGTTTASIALTEPGVHVDSFVSIGSAGLTPSIGEASICTQTRSSPGRRTTSGRSTPRRATSGRGSGAPSATTRDPVGDDFGAKTFGVDTGKGGTSVTDHGVSTPDGTGYLDPGTESLRNVARHDRSRR